MFDPVIKILESGCEGPTTVIMGGVHGDEPSGVKAVEYFMSNLVIQKGRVILIIANPVAIKESKRYHGYNLNRAFLNGIELPSYEKRCVKIISEYLDQADFLLDLHNTVKNESPRFLIVEEGDIYGRLFDVEYVVTGITTSHPGSTDEYVHRNGKIGICLECGWIQKDTLANEKFAIDNAINFLSYIGHIDNGGDISITIKNQKVLNFGNIYIAQKMFRSYKKFEDFEIVKKGASIGSDGKQEIVASEDSYILFCETEADSGNECFLLTNMWDIR